MNHRGASTQKFVVGDLIEWTSQAGGRTQTKMGEVMLVVKPGQPPLNAALHAGVRIPPSFASGLGVPRNHESYLLKAVKVTGLGRGKIDWYWPLVSKLKLIPVANVG